MRLLNQVQSELDEHKDRYERPQLLQDLAVSTQACRVLLHEIQDSAHLMLKGSLEQPIWRKLGMSSLGRRQLQNYSSELNHCSVTLIGFLTLLGTTASQDGQRRIIELVETMRTDAGIFQLEVHRDGLDQIQLPRMHDGGNSDERTGAEEARQWALADGSDPNSEANKGSEALVATESRQTQASSAVEHLEPHVSESSHFQVLNASPALRSMSNNRIDDHQSQPHEDKPQDTPVPSFKMWLARPPRAEDSWHFINISVSGQIVLNFFNRYATGKWVLKPFDKICDAAIKEISALLESTVAEMSALRVSYENNVMLRFLRGKTKQIEILTKPLGANEQVMIGLLRSEEMPRGYAGFPTLPAYHGPGVVLNQPAYSTPSLPPASSHLHRPGVSMNLPRQMQPPTNYPYGPASNAQFPSAFKSTSSVLQTLSLWMKLNDNTQSELLRARRYFVSAKAGLDTLSFFVWRWDLPDEDLQAAGLVNWKEISRMTEYAILGHLSLQ